MTGLFCQLQNALGPLSFRRTRCFNVLNFQVLFICQDSTSKGQCQTGDVLTFSPTVFAVQEPLEHMQVCNSKVNYMLLDDFGCFLSTCIFSCAENAVYNINIIRPGQGVTTAAPQDDRAVLSVAECAGASFFCLVVLWSTRCFNVCNFEVLSVCQDSTSKRHFETGDVLTCILPHSFGSSGTFGAHAGLQLRKGN